MRPDENWHKWKVEGTPLETVRRRLAARGLKDPWLRNEAWRYTGKFAHGDSLATVLLRGFKWGFVVFSVALAVEYTLFPEKKSDH